MKRLHSRAFQISVAMAAPLAAFLVQSTPAYADPMTKDQCIDAHSRGQTLRDTGKLSEARELFLKCAQSGCPSLIQGDCARFADETTRTVPSVTFVARDAKGNDIVDTIVFVDDLQVAERLDQGKSFDVDPGEHTVRFLHRDKKVEQKIVVHQGERERLIVGTFPDLGAPEPSAPTPTPPASVEPAAPTPKDDKPKQNLGPILVTSGGVVVLATGVVLAVVGLGKVPSQCSYWSKDCSAAPGNPVFDDAKSGARLVNAGIIVGSVGLAAIAGGVIWSFVEKPGDGRKRDSALTPWFDPRSAGVSWARSF